MQIIVFRGGMILEPFREWASGVNPFWWQSYNRVKHHRNEHYNEANLKNAMYAVAGLFAIVLYYLQVEARVGTLFPDPIMMYVPREKGSPLYNGYVLPDFD